MIFGLAIVVLIIAVLLWTLKIAVSIAVIFGLVGIVMLIVSFVSPKRGRRSSNR